MINNRRLGRFNMKRDEDEFEEKTFGLQNEFKYFKKVVKKSKSLTTRKAR